LLSLVVLQPAQPSYPLPLMLMAHVTTLPGISLLLLLLLAQDMQRALVEYASVVFIMADKYAPDPLLEDKRSIMTAMALGQYLQERRLELEQRLSHPVQAAITRLRHLPVSRGDTHTECDSVNLGW
jgi:hypothetical protein